MSSSDKRLAEPDGSANSVKFVAVTFISYLLCYAALALSWLAGIRTLGFWQIIATRLSLPLPTKQIAALDSKVAAVVPARVQAAAPHRLNTHMRPAHAARPLAVLGVHRA